MNGKNVKLIKRKVREEQQKVADELIIQLFQSPFKYRFLFAMKLIRGKL